MALGTRTKTEIEANDLDMEMDRMAKRLMAFAEDHATGVDAGIIDRLGHHLGVNRNLVRRYMHRADIEATK